MDTWWKRCKYGKLTKAVAVLLLCIVGFTGLQSFVSFTLMPRETYGSEYYFVRQLITQGGYVRDWIVRYATADRLEESSVSEEDIAEYLKANNMVLATTSAKKVDRNQNQEEEVANTTTERIDESTEEVTHTSEVAAEQSVAYSVEQVKEIEDITVVVSDGMLVGDGRKQITRQEVIDSILLGRKNYYKKLQAELQDRYVNIEFFGYNKVTGDVVTNRTDYVAGKEAQIMEDLSKRDYCLIGNGSSFSMPHYYGTNMGVTSDTYYTGKDFLDADDYAIYVALKSDLVAGDWFHENYVDYRYKMATKNTAVETGVISIAGILLVGIYWVVAVGRSPRDTTVVNMQAIDRVPLEVQLVGYGMSAFLLSYMGISLIGHLIDLGWIPYMTHIESQGAYLFGLFLLVIVGVLLTLFVGSSFIRHVKNRSLMQYSGILRIIRWGYTGMRSIGRELFTEKTLPIAPVVLVVGYVAMNGIMLFGVLLVPPFVIVWIGFNIAVAVCLVFVVKQYLVLHRGAKQIANGNLEEKIVLPGGLPILVELATQLNAIGDGMETAVEQALKSERFKSELITNVSHDLKTPLTSIISYIDLLKEEEVENEVAKEYIAILEERSNRLKTLVEDLVDASKAVTGNIETRLEVLSLDQLVAQAIGEYSDRLMSQSLEVIEHTDVPVLVRADARHIWRVVENLLSNVSKYAMPHTRVYMDVQQEGNCGVLIIRNISKEPILVAASELTKRFVRGEESRSTDGTGLGLAIAQSLVKLQHGELQVSIDGDLFKVVIRLPLAEK